jgi:hypothetical protein
MLATIGGIGATATLLIAASHNTGLTLSLDLGSAKSLWEIVTAGVFWATAFNWIFEKWLWRLSLLRVWLIKVPDLSGRWEGTSESGFFKEKERGEKIPISACIDHRFDRIIYTQKSITDSIGNAVDLSTDENGFYSLTVAYYNIPQPAADHAPGQLTDHSREHNGCSRMVLWRPPKERKATQKWTLKGSYWTDKLRSLDHEDRGTTGKLELHWKTKEC